MISRYTRPEMGRIWALENRYRTWLEVELAVCEGLAKIGKIPREALQVIRQKASFSVKRIEELERITRHDVAAFVQCVAESIGPEGRFIHLGLTSSDVLDTSMAMLLRDALDLIASGMKKLLHRLRDLAIQHKTTVMIGRTHGVHAEPITFGLKMLLWYEETKRNLERLRAARQSICYGKISGAVGTYAHIDPRVEEYVCEKLGLLPAPISNQVIQRDRYAHCFTTLAILASSIEKFALEIRHLQRTEVREAEEGFGKGQKGSSAMPHKKNPITAENICGLSRLVRGNALAALENVALWHERDISHSSVERVIGPDSTILVDTMLHRFVDLLDELVVHPKVMMENLATTRGLIYSEAVLLLLVEKGASRDRAYELVQRNAIKVWDDGKDFQEVLGQDPDVMAMLDDGELRSCVDLKRSLAHVDLIYRRVLGDAVR
ncbi:MAG: adenylosuccinate lyase [Thermodesulfobacteriota bacterium]